MLVAEDFGEHPVCGHGIHHPGIAHEQDVHIGQHADEHGKVEELAADLSKPGFEQEGADAGGILHFVVPNHLHIGIVDGEVEQDHDDDADDDAFLQRFLSVDLGAEVDGLLVPSIGEGNRHHADHQQQQPIAAIIGAHRIVAVAMRLNNGAGKQGRDEDEDERHFYDHQYVLCAAAGFETQQVYHKEYRYRHYTQAHIKYKSQLPAKEQVAAIFCPNEGDHGQ